MRALVAAAAFGAMIAACGPPVPARPVGPAPVVVPRPTPDDGAGDAPPPAPPEGAAAPTITWARVAEPGDVPAAPPPPGTWRVHLIDVGTGLSVLVQGADFSLLFDAGSNDPVEKPLRALAYLGAALGPSGDGLCVAKDAPRPARQRAIDHVVLSHPHQDHGSALDLVLHCYDVAHVWDAGAINHAVFYRDFVEAVAREAGATYHTAADVPDDRTVTIKGFDVTLPAEVAWQPFSEGDVVTLGADARFTILHAEGKTHRDHNASSIVLLVELGGARLLLTGDAESGPRADPSAPLGDVEAHLVDHFAEAIDADILQVGHHGSKTSSRRAFLDAVSPTLALVSAGPKAYRGTRLPDAEVIDALVAAGATVLRTDTHDAACPATARLGPATGPGGCDAHIVTITAPAP